MISATILLALCLALFSGAVWARGTTVSVGETIPVGGTTTTTTTTTSEDEEGSSEPIHQVTLIPADGEGTGSTEGSDWENAEILGGGSGNSGAEAGTGEASTAGSTARTGTGATAQNQQGGASGCAPAFILMGAALALFASRK